VLNNCFNASHQLGSGWETRNASMAR